LAASVFVAGVGEVAETAPAVVEKAPEIIEDAAKAIEVWRDGSVGAAQVRLLQTGGNTIATGTAKALNEANGMNLTVREWGRALEALKKAEELANNFHGAIDSAATYLDPTGNIFGSIIECVP
jgi:hypothetical protein